MKKELLIILLKVLAYAIGLLLAFFGASAIVSCSVSRSFTGRGTTTIVTTDTTHISHDGYIRYPRR